MEITVYDALGREVALLLNEERAAGSYEVDFNAAALSNGIYFYRISAEGFTRTRKMIVLK